MPYVGHSQSATPRRTLIPARPAVAALATRAATGTRPPATSGKRVRAAATHGRGPTPTIAPTVAGVVGTIARAPRVGRGQVRRASARSLGNYNDARALDYYAGDDLEGFFSSIAKAVKKVASPIQKGLTSVGHAVGSAVTSKVGQGILGGALALTGVGAPAAAAIFAGTKATGNLIKKGGNLKHAATGALQGAVEGVAAVGIGKAVRGVKNEITGALSKRASTAAVQAAGGTPAASQAIVDNILSKGVPGIEAPIPSAASLFIPQVTAPALPADNEAAIAAAVQAADNAAQIQAQAQAAIAAANAAAQAAIQQNTDAANQAAAAAAANAAQQQAAAQAAIDAANQAAQLAQQQQPATTSAPTFDTSDSGDSFLSTEQQQQAAAAQQEAQAEADAQAAARSATTKKLVIAGGVLLGAGGVVLAMKKHKRGRR